MPFEIKSPSSQVAAYLRKELLAGNWRFQLPGTPALAAELEVDRKTITAAIQQLEAEGLLISQGHGRPRKVVLPEKLAPNKLNIGVLPYDETDRQLPFVLEMLHRIQQTGHNVSIASKTLPSLGMDPERVARFTTDNPADAWITMSASYDVLNWFASQPFPAFAIFGRRRRVEIASVGPDKIPAIRSAVNHLTALGHTRIVLIARAERRTPTPGKLEQEFLQQLELRGIQPGPYHLPDWEESPQGFHTCLHNLFQHTPPTALLIDEPQFFVAAQQHLAAKGIVAPRDISLVSCDTHPLFDWCQPAVSHIHWDTKPIVNHTLRWVEHLATGKQSRSAIYTKAEFIEGGTIGPAPGPEN